MARAPVPQLEIRLRQEHSAGFDGMVTWPSGALEGLVRVQDLGFSELAYLHRARQVVESTGTSHHDIAINAITTAAFLRTYARVVVLFA